MSLPSQGKLVLRFVDVFFQKQCNRPFGGGNFGIHTHAYTFNYKFKRKQRNNKLDEELAEVDDNAAIDDEKYDSPF